MLIAARESFAAAARKRLPYDAEVQYLQSSGTQWIDTGIVPFADDGYTSVEYRASTASNLRSAIVSNFHVSNTYGVLSSEFGGQANSYPFHIRGYAETTSGYVSLWSAALTANTPADVFVSFNVARKTLVLQVDGASQTAVLSRALVAATDTLALFKDYRASPTGFANSVRIYHMDISSGAGYVRRFVPVRFTNEQGVSEGAMYDRVNPTVGMNPDGSARTDGLYRNRGTGAFTFGSDIN